MARKMLTAIDQQVARAVTAQTIMTTQQTVQETARQYAQETLLKTVQTEGLRFLNVQRLMAIQHALELTRYIPFIPPPERQKTVTSILTPPQEEEELLTKRYITQKQEQEIRTQRRLITRLEKRLQEIQERLLTPIALNLIDHTALCMLDKLLWESNPTQVTQITQQLLEMVQSRTQRIRPILGYEALQKHMLQLYIPMFMTFPYTVNLISLRISQLTLQSLLGKQVTLYYTGAMQAQAVKTKQQILCCQKRRMETKQVSSGKSIVEQIPLKYYVSHKPFLTGEEKVEIPSTFTMRQALWLSLRYAYNMPYWIRRMIAVTTGMPENYKYAYYFNINGVATRTTFRARLQRKYPEAMLFNYSRQKDIMEAIINFGTRYRQAYRYHRITRYLPRKIRRYARM